VVRDLRGTGQSKKGRSRFTRTAVAVGAAAASAPNSAASSAMVSIGTKSPAFISPAFGNHHRGLPPTPEGQPRILLHQPAHQTFAMAGAADGHRFLMP